MMAALLGVPRERRAPTLARRVAPSCAALAVDALGRTLRLSVAGADSMLPLWSADRPLIYVMWHGRILMGPWINVRLRASHGARRVTVLTSQSRDGELLARYAARFGLPAVRGSSSRGGVAAVRALARVLREGEDVVVVPDGPRGPAGRLHRGVAVLARMTGVPVVPLAFAARPALRLASWDRLLVPVPFARAAVVFGAPLTVERDADRARARDRIESALDCVTAQAEALVR